jgi:hypothetical protein
MSLSRSCDQRPLVRAEPTVATAGREFGDPPARREPDEDAERAAEDRHADCNAEDVPRERAFDKERGAAEYGFAEPITQTRQQLALTP